MDEDFKHQITECYQILSNKSADSQQVQEVSAFLTEFYSKPEAFSLIVDFILSVHDSTSQNGAIVGMKMIIEKNADLLQEQETYNSLLNLSISKSSYVRSLAIFYLSFFESPAELLIQFVESLFNPTTQDKISDIQIETCMKLISIVLKNIEDDDKLNEKMPDYIEFCSTLSTQAFKSSNIELHISGAIFRLTFIPFIQNDQDPIYQEYMSSSFQVLYQVLEKKSESDQIDELIRSISLFICNNPDSIDYQSLFEVVINFISTPEISLSLSEQLLLLLDNVLLSCKDTIKTQENQIEIILQILNAYCHYTKRTYDSSNSYDLSNNLTFSTFFKAFYEDQYISEIYSNISALFNEDSSGKFTTLLILDSSFETSSDFYRTKINEILEILQASLSDDAFCVKSTASIAITDFCRFLRPTVEFDSIINSLFECISSTPSIEFLESLTDIFDVCIQTDTFFDQCINFFSQLFEAVGDIIVRQKIITCISSLTKNSNERVCAFYDQIFSLMSNIVQTASTDENSLSLLPPALSCLSHLCFKCAFQMTSFAPSLLDTAAQFISDESCQLECINALSAVCQNFTENVHEAAPQILKPLFEIAERKIDFESLDLNEDDEIFDFQGEVGSNASALRCLCTILSIYKDLLAQNFDNLFNLLMNFKDDFNPDGTIACAVGATSIAKSLVEIEGSDEQILNLISKILIPLAKGSDYETSGRGFFGLSVAVKKGQNFVNEDIFDSILLALEGHLFFQHETVSYNETLFDGLFHLLKSLMKLNFFNEIQKLTPTIQNFLHSKSGGLRDFSLKFFGYHVSIPNGIQFLDEKLVSEVLQIALEVDDGYASIEFLTKLTDTVPESVSDVSPKIIESISSRLFQSSDGEITIIKNEPIFIEKCVLLLQSLLQKTKTDISMFIPLIIQSTPPKVLLRKSGRFYELINWINENHNADGELNQQIAASAIRLFCEPDCLIEKRNLNKDELNKIKSIIRSLSESIPNFSDFCEESCDNDHFKMSNLNSHVFES